MLTEAVVVTVSAATLEIRTTTRVPPVVGPVETEIEETSGEEGEDTRKAFARTVPREGNPTGSTFNATSPGLLGGIVTVRIVGDEESRAGVSWVSWAETAPKYTSKSETEDTAIKEDTLICTVVPPEGKPLVGKTLVMTAGGGVSYIHGNSTLTVGLEVRKTAPTGFDAVVAKLRRGTTNVTVIALIPPATLESTALTTVAESGPIVTAAGHGFGIGHRIF